MKAAITPTLLLAMCALQAQSQRYSLEEAKAFALENSIELQNAELAVTGAQASVNQVTRMGLPQVNGEVSYMNYLELPTSLIPAEFLGGNPGEFAELKFGTTNNMRASATATQLVFDGSFLIGVKAAKMFVDLQRKEKQRKEQEVTAAVSKAYYSVLVTSRNLELLNQSRDLMKRLHHEARELFGAGFIEEIEVDRLTLALASLEAQIGSVEKYAALTQSLLKFQMGLDLATAIELTDSLSQLTQVTRDIASMPVDVAQRIEWNILDMQRALQEANIRRYRSGYLPSVGAFFTYDYSAQRSAFDFFEAGHPWFTTSAWGVSVRVPIFDSFSKSAGIQKEKTNLQIIMNYRTQLQQAIGLEVESGRTAYLNATEQEKTQRANLGLAQKILDISTIKYKEGVGSSLEVTSAQTTLLQTQSAYINSLYELLIAKTDLEKALGVL